MCRYQSSLQRNHKHRRHINAALVKDFLKAGEAGHVDHWVRVLQRRMKDTKRILGRLTASQMACASAASFLPFLPNKRYGITNLGAIKRAVWP